MKVNGTVTSAAASTSNSTKSVASDIDTTAFLKLLTAQLQYQDPLEPMDGEAMLTQLSQLTTVSELTSLNNNFEEMASGGMNVSNMSSLLGKTIYYSDGAGGTDSGIASQVQKGTNGWEVCVGDVVLHLDEITAVAS